MEKTQFLIIKINANEKRKHKVLFCFVRSFSVQLLKSQTLDNFLIIIFSSKQLTNVVDSTFKPYTLSESLSPHFFINTLDQTTIIFHLDY